MKMKRLIGLLCVLSLLLSMWGCGKKENDTGRQTEPAGSGDFILAVSEAPDSLNPFTAENAAAREMFLLVYDPLWRIDGDYKPQNCLVESYDLSSDGLTWTIRLRQDVTFSDGEALTSGDVKFSYELFAQYGTDSSALYDGISSIKCPDDWTVVITTSYVKGDLCYSQTPILPEHIWSAYEDEPDAMDNSAMVGSGPFIYQPPELEPGEEQSRWTLVSRGDYFAGSAKLQSLSMEVYDAAAASHALADGLVDGCMDMTDVQLFGISDLYGVESYVVQGPQLGSCMLLFNTRDSALAAAAVREAILYCIDWDSVYTMGFGGAGENGDGILPPNSPYYSARERKYSFDPAKALTLLTAIGYADGDGDGILESLDNTIELSFRLYSGAEDTWATAAVSTLSRELAEIGVEIDWVTDSEEALEQRCTKGGSWDMYLTSGRGSCDAQDIMRDFAGGRSVTGWQSESFDSLYERLLRSMDEQEKTDILYEMESCLIDESACAVLGYNTKVQAIRADRWTGYASPAAQQGGLFGTGCIDVYMQLRPYTEGEDSGDETTGEESTEVSPAESETYIPEPITETVTRENTAAENATPMPMATAVPLPE